MSTRDRRARVLESTTVNGIDFVAVDSTQTVLTVHFLNAVELQQTMSDPPTITGGESIASVTVLPIRAGDWGWDDGHVVLILRVLAPGDFSTYTLTIDNPVLDRFFDHVPFSFKAGCPSDLDCQPAATNCPPISGNPPPIDYLAKDFLSFRQALLDFSTLRYANWQERSEADFGVMFLEALSAVADDLSYMQDRIAAEATLLTATQRRSVLRHARLVDYPMLPAVSAGTTLQFEVSPAAVTIPKGLAAVAGAPDGTPVTFETGLGLSDTSPPPPANFLWNRSASVPMCGYWFDDSERCLPVGATAMHVLGHGWGFQPGQALLIETTASNPGDPPTRQIVHLLQAGDPAGPPSREICDAIFTRTPTEGGPPFLTIHVSPPGSSEAPTAVTRIQWEGADQLTVARDLAGTTLIGNLCPATQGRTVRGESFVIGAASTAAANFPPAAIERTGPTPLISAGVCGEPPTVRFYTLVNSPLAWLPQPLLDPSGLPVPQIVLDEASTGAWQWQRSLLTASALQQAFTIEPLSYRTIATNSDDTVQSDYDGDGGDTIRFGESVFGANPDEGMQFTVTYRYGAGAAGNVSADAIAQLDPTVVASGLYFAVTNPLPATGGADAQTLQSVRRLAPQQFRAVPLRAVLAQDYAATAQTLPWVKVAGSVFRWTGSWLTNFTTPEPVASEQIATAQRTSLINLLNRFRMAGTETYVPDPDFVSLDLQVELCALPDAFAAQVKQSVTAALSPIGPGAANAYFAVNRFEFGQALQRSTLEAAIQAVPGVAGVTCIEYRLRNQTSAFREMPDVVPVGSNQILRCDNDPSRPGAGALAVSVGGGR